MTDRRKGGGRSGRIAARGMGPNTGRNAPAEMNPYDDVIIEWERQRFQAADSEGRRGSRSPAEAGDGQPGGTARR